MGVWEKERREARFPSTKQMDFEFMVVFFRMQTEINQ
jgi:hypothetical protein